MKSILIKAIIGLVLCAGSLVGGLAATGRLNHDGTANIPLLSSFFPEPLAPPEGEAGKDGKDGKAGEQGGAAKDAADAGHAAPAEADHTGAPGTPADASAANGAQEPQGDKPRKQKVGKSVEKPEPPPGEGGGHGGGGGQEGGGEAAGGHGETKAEGGHGETKAEKGGHGATGEDKKEDAKGEHAAVSDFEHLAQALEKDPQNKYAPGGYFRFDGMPAGLTPEQINEAWQRVQSVLADIEKRKTALDLREQELNELADDISRRQHELSDQRLKIEQEHRRLDARIAKFQEQVKLVRNDEVASLKRNAQTLAAFEPSKAAELVQEQWKTERGQDEVLRLFEFMEQDAVNDVLKVLPQAVVQDILKKRLRVSKEATPAAPR